MEKDLPRDDSHDVTFWLQQLQSSDQAIREEARRSIFERYTRMFTASIWNRLPENIRTRVGADDIHQEVMAAFFRKASIVRKSGEELSALTDREKLLNLLFNMALNKCINAWKHHHRPKRDVNREVSMHADASDEENKNQFDNLVNGKQLPAIGNEKHKKHQARNYPVIPPIDTRGDSFFENKDAIDLLVCGADQESLAAFEEVYKRIKEMLDKKGGHFTKVFEMQLGKYSEKEMAEAIGKTVARVRQMIKVIRDCVKRGISPDFKGPFVEPDSDA